MLDLTITLSTRWRQKDSNSLVWFENSITWKYKPCYPSLYANVQQYNYISRQERDPGEKGKRERWSAIPSASAHCSELQGKMEMFIHEPRPALMRAIPIPSTKISSGWYLSQIRRGEAFDSFLVAPRCFIVYLGSFHLSLSIRRTTMSQFNVIAPRLLLRVWRNAWNPQKTKKPYN